MKYFQYIKTIFLIMLDKIFNRFGVHFSSKKFCGSKHLTDIDANELIASYIRKGEPFALCRFGTSESSFLAWHDEHQLFGTNRIFQHILACMLHDEAEMNRFAEMLAETCKNTDIMVYFKDNHLEEYIFGQYYKNSQYIQLYQLDAMGQNIPWTMALEGKKVLIISPFADIINSQYTKKELLFNGKDVLPEMNLELLKAVWYIDAKTDNGGFSSWFEALDYMYNEAMKLDFEIVLLSCGQFGRILCTRFKNVGKQAIDYGGSLQVLFGIKGSRWDSNSEINKFYNEFWVRPPKSEAPSTERGVQLLDKGCYW